SLRGQSIVPCQDRSGTHRVCHGQSRQGRYGVALQWHAAPFGGRAVQDDHWRRHASRAYPGDVPALNDLVAGKVQLQFSGLGAAMEYIKLGKLRALAVTTATRTEFLPDVPTVGDFLPGYAAPTWLGTGAPKDTPAEIIERLNKEINAGLADASLKAQFAKLGHVPMPMTPTDFGRFVAAETDKWGPVVKAVGIKPQ